MVLMVTGGTSQWTLQSLTAPKKRWGRSRPTQWEARTTSYTPTQVGTYTIVATIPAQVITGLPDIPPGLPYSPAPSTILMQPAQATQLHSPYSRNQYSHSKRLLFQHSYWTRPINSANRNWCALAGNWLAGAAQNVGPTTNFGYGPGPESAHIMWAKPYVGRRYHGRSVW